jgi:hypothetical protein
MQSYTLLIKFNYDQLHIISFSRYIYYAVMLQAFPMVYAAISPTKRTSMGPHRKLEINVGYHSLLIIKYLEPLIGDLFTA